MAFDRVALERPIREGEPSGDWLRRDGTYTAVQDAMKAQAADPAYGIEEKRPDWSAVERICLEALSNQTKDLYLAICLLEAAATEEGVAGVADSIWMIRKLHEGFWDDFHPRPRDGNQDGRLNQIEALVRGFQRIVDTVPMGGGSDPLTFFDWRHTDVKLPNGEPSAWTGERRRQAILSTSWDFYDEGLKETRRAREETRALDECIEAHYGEQAPSLSEMAGVLEDLETAFSQALAERGPGPHVQGAREILDQTGCSFLELDWLAEHVRAGLPTSRVLSSLQAAVNDERNGVRPEEGWPTALEEAWAGERSYEQKSPEMPQTTVETPPRAAAIPAPPAPSAPQGSVPPAPAPAAGSAQALVGACRGLRAAEPGNSLAYTVLRFVRWHSCERPGEDVGLPAPPKGTREHLTSLFENGRWADLLESSESLLESEVGPYWIDLQRFTCAAMGQIGAPHGPSRSEILRQLGDHVRRHPWLSDASLGDGTPAADDVTRNWLSAEVLTESETRGLRQGPASEPGAASVLAEALEVLESDGFEASLGLVSARLEEARSGRSRALASLDLGELCLAADRPDLAAPVLEGVRRDLSVPEIARWEGPELSARGLSTLYHAYVRLVSTDAGGEHEGRLRDLAGEIARLDMGLRLQLEASQT